jgi:hypothetical protein
MRSNQLSVLAEARLAWRVRSTRARARMTFAAHGGAARSLESGHMHWSRASIWNRAEADEGALCARRGAVDNCFWRRSVRDVPSTRERERQGRAGHAALWWSRACASIIPIPVLLRSSRQRSRHKRGGLFTPGRAIRILMPRGWRVECEGIAATAAPAGPGATAAGGGLPCPAGDAGSVAGVSRRGRRARSGRRLWHQATSTDPNPGPRPPAAAALGQGVCVLR